MGYTKAVVLGLFIGFALLFAISSCKDKSEEAAPKKPAIGHTQTN